ncbi:MAG: pseudaminic acid synthase [Patescibacteria group bacterium]
MKKQNKNIIKIGNKIIGTGQPVFIVADMSGNHGGSFQCAKKLIAAAAAAGADAIKMQSYLPETITIDCANKYFQINDGGFWDGQTLYALYKKGATPWIWHSKLKKYAEKQGIIFFSTPFDVTAVSLLEKIKVPLYKIASLELSDTPLLEKIGKTGKPVIMSRGTATLKEIKYAIKTLKQFGCPQICLLHCVSAYPARPGEMNLKTIPDINRRLKVIAGLSDHTLGYEISLAAVALGASIIEKHLVLSRKDKVIDAFFSLEPAEFKEMVSSIRKIEKSLGRVNYQATKEEKAAVAYRKSLFIIQDIKRGERFIYSKNIRSIRPGYGLEPKYYKSINGRRAKIDLKKGTPLKWNLILR